VTFPAGSYQEYGGTPVVDCYEALGRIYKQIRGQNISKDALQVVVQENIISNHQTVGHFQPQEVPAHSFPTKGRRSHQHHRQQKQKQERKQSKESQKKKTKKRKEKSFFHINHHGLHNFSHTPPTLALGLPPLPPY
jgi:hypothetical protein